MSRLPATKPRVPEADVKKEVREWLEVHHIHNLKTMASAQYVRGFYWMPVQTGFGVTGVSDFNIVFMGRFIAAEAKATHVKAEPTPLQRRFIESVEKAGGIGFTFNSLDMFVKIWIGKVDEQHYLYFPEERG